MSRQKAEKRSVFAELMEGVGAMQGHREGKVTLRTHPFPNAEVKESPGAEFFVAVREKFNVSRAVWANMLRVSPRTVEKWEQGGQVSPLAATFVELVLRYPDTIERLQTLPRRISRIPGSSSAVLASVTVRELFDIAGLPVCGPVKWNDPVDEKRPGVYLVATVPNPDDSCGLVDADVIDAQIAARWVPLQPILYVGQTTRPLAKRIREFYRHVHGDKAPHRGGQDIKLLSFPQWVYWSPTERAEEAEFKMIEAFEARVNRLPFGNLKRPSRHSSNSETSVVYA